MSLAFDFRDKVLDSMLGSGIFASLHSSDPKDSGSNELKGNGYERQPVSFLLSVGGTKTNSKSLAWTNLPRTNSVKFVGLWSDDTAGDFLWSIPLSDEKSINAGDTLSIGEGKLSLSVS